MKTALLIIDVQNDYFPNGNCQLHESETALNVIKTMLKYFRDHHLPIYFVQHISAEGATFFVPDTDGVNIHQDIKPLDSEKLIIKHSPNSFHKTNLQSELEKDGIDKLVICGMMTHMCVDTTVRCAKDLGYSNILISDACSTKDLEWNGMSLPASIVQKVYFASIDGSFAKIVTGEEYLTYY